MGKSQVTNPDVKALLDLIESYEDRIRVARSLILRIQDECEHPELPKRTANDGPWYDICSDCGHLSTSFRGESDLVS